MLVIAHHHIQDPDAFWSAAQNVPSILPPELKLHSVFPSKDLRTGTCVWEANSAEEVQKFLDDNVGNVSKNFTYEVDERAAMGLPKKTEEAFSAS
ncbi:MAG: hypothetical protein ICV66_00425 [Chitinophagaceae bacterium]|nr:hypothetical protein [Chitinophagaceae bacterium]